MDKKDIMKRRLKNVIIKIEKQIEEEIVEYGDDKILINCPKDLIKDISDHFEDQGFIITKEKYEINDYECYGTGEYGWHYYISL